MAKLISFSDLFSARTINNFDHYGIPYDPYIAFADEMEAYVYRQNLMAQLEEAIDCDDRED